VDNYGTYMEEGKEDGSIVNEPSTFQGEGPMACKRMNPKTSISLYQQLLILTCIGIDNKVWAVGGGKKIKRSR